MKHAEAMNLVLRVARSSANGAGNCHEILEACNVVESAAVPRVAVRKDLPDSDVTVLMVTTDREYPVWPGFHDGERWCSADASEFEGCLLGWLHLDEAAALLRGKSAA